MEKKGRFELYTLDECIDEMVGKVGSPERTTFDAEVDEAVNAYHVGEAIKNARLSQNLTQEELGERVGVKKSQISKLEHGCDMRLSTVGRVFKALGIPSVTVDLGTCGKVALW